jgi:hypothetical protein
MDFSIDLHESQSTPATFDSKHDKEKSSSMLTLRFEK